MASEMPSQANNPTPIPPPTPNVLPIASSVYFHDHRREALGYCQLNEFHQLDDFEICPLKFSSGSRVIRPPAVQYYIYVYVRTHSYLYIERASRVLGADGGGLFERLFGIGLRSRILIAGILLTMTVPPRMRR